MVLINWTNQSIDDLSNIGEYISKDSPRFAQETLQKIRAKAQKLKQFKNLGRIVPEFESKNVRELFLGSYRIIYHIYSTKRIDILTIHHSSKILNTGKLPI